MGNLPVEEVYNAMNLVGVYQPKDEENPDARKACMVEGAPGSSSLDKHWERSGVRVFESRPYGPAKSGVPKPR